MVYVKSGSVTQTTPASTTTNNGHKKKKNNNNHNKTTSGSNNMSSTRTTTTTTKSKTDTSAHPIYQLMQNHVDGNVSTSANGKSNKKKEVTFSSTDDAEVMKNFQQFVSQHPEEAERLSRPVSSSTSPRSPVSKFIKKGAEYSSYLSEDEEDEMSLSSCPSKRSHASSPSTTTTSPVKKMAWSCARVWCLDVPLALTFALMLSMHGLGTVYNDYYKPLFDRAQRTNAQLVEEYTYYERRCTEADLSTRQMTDLFVNKSAPITNALDQMMKHGAMVIPEILKPETVRALREYLVGRNANITNAEEFPMSQGYKRLSYGIDGSEAPAVSNALQEIARNPWIRKTLQGVLGDHDPASSEITAITAYPGCKHQSWHPDTKPNGNAVKFARTYHHSYSLFIPMQDTTGPMGASDICVGSHYCSNQIDAMCDRNKMGLHQTSPGGVFRAGDGALLNQHVWHRGAKHDDFNAPERIMFIVSFLARPNFGRDPRQLSRGTYFHQKWNMWGHTWSDLTNPALYMRTPFSILRCLRLWKPSDHHYGYDLITSGFMRFANEQLGSNDLDERMPGRLRQLHFPTWLQGDRTKPETKGKKKKQKERWEHFIATTLEKMKTFFEYVFVGTHAVYAFLLLFAMLFAFQYQGFVAGIRLVVGSGLRLLVTHGLVLFLAYKFMKDLQASPWARDIVTGRTLARPFLPVPQPLPDATTSLSSLSPTVVPILLDDTEATHPSLSSLTTSSSVATVVVSEGPTTWPRRADVLLGTRYDAAFLGSYDRWLDYHPGNVNMRSLLEQYGPYFPTYQSLGGVFTDAMIQSIIDWIQLDHQGRFLHQDYRTGDWRIMTTAEIWTAVTQELWSASHPCKSHMRKALDWLVAEYRFGARLRHFAMAKTSLRDLQVLRNRVLSAAEDVVAVRVASYQHKISKSRWANVMEEISGNKDPRTASQQSSLLLHPRPIRRQVSLQQHEHIPAWRRWKRPPANMTRYEFRPGTEVWVRIEEENAWIPGVVTHVTLGSDIDDIDEEDLIPSEYYHDVALEDGRFAIYSPKDLMRHAPPIVEGVTRLRGCFKTNLQNCFNGIAGHVWPSGHVTIYYDDGDVKKTPPTHYFIPPFAYIKAGY